MVALVENAREAKADIKLSVGNVIQRLFIDGRQGLVDNTNTYNALLKDTLPDWFRWESPITQHPLLRRASVGHRHTRCFFGAYTTTGLSLIFPGLSACHRYGVCVATYINLNPGSLTSFTVTPGGVPAPPASLSFTTIDATTLELSWPGIRIAAGYTIYIRSLTSGSFEVIGRTSATSQGFALPLPRYLDLPALGRLR